VPAPVPLPPDPPPLDERMRKVFFEGPAMDHGTSVIALRGDRYVGITITHVKENGIAYTNFTGVRREERGKGIATAMKLRVLRALRERGIRSFGTTNDEQNAAMRGINERLGYRPEPPTLIVRKVLET
jgi:RimJ/RimL family protein N-acetyltransferase